MLYPIIGVVLTSSTALIKWIAILITNEYISKLKQRKILLGDWIKVICLLYGKSLKQSTIDKKVYDKEAQELKKIYNHYLNKRGE